MEQKRFPLVLIILIVAVLGTFGYFVYKNYISKPYTPSPTTTATGLKVNWKTYINDYYNFKLEIPKDWKIEEYIVKNNSDEHQTYKLSSSNNELIIASDNTSKNNHVKQQLPHTVVSLGQYTVDRYPYINDNNEKVDGIFLINIKRQDTVSFYFTINGDFKKNNGLLLSILKTFTYAKQRPSFDDEITYIIPQGWRKENTDVSLYLSFVSGDFKEEGLPTIVSGARITINKIKKDPTKTFAQQTTSNYYSIENNGNIWTVSMVCSNNCGDTVYKKEMDIFIKSIKFK